MFDELYNWLVLGLNFNESLSLINDDSFGLSTDFVIAILESNQWILYDIYNPCKLRGGSLKITKLGIWNETTGLNIFLELEKIRRWNLEGMTLKTAGFVCQLWLFQLKIRKDYCYNSTYKLIFAGKKETTSNVPV